MNGSHLLIAVRTHQANLSITFCRLSGPKKFMLATFAEWERSCKRLMPLLSEQAVSYSPNTGNDWNPKSG